MKRFGGYRILNVDISQPVPALPALGGAEGALLVFWWKDLPLGQRYVRQAHFPVESHPLQEMIREAVTPAISSYTDEPLRAAGSPGASFAGDLERLAELKPCPLDIDTQLTGTLKGLELSVVICTRDRPEELQRCLSSFARLVEPPQQLLVVDNAPKTDATQQLVREFGHVEYVREPRSGLDIARNTGVRHSRCPIVAYVDDDVEVHPRWAARLRRPFTDPAVQAVTGQVLPAELDSLAQYIFETDWGFNRGYVPKRYDRAFYEQTRGWGTPAWDIGAGANMAFRRSAFRQLGGFDERLDAGAAGVAGDSEFFYRILARGGVCCYAPSALVYHYHRRTLAALRSQLYAYSRGHAAALLMQYDRYGDLGNLKRLGLTLPRYYLEEVGRTLLHPRRRRRYTLPHEIRGYFAGLRYYIKHRMRGDAAVPTFSRA